MNPGAALAAAFLLWAIWVQGPASAFEPLGGCFVADRVCPALLSIRKGTNPGGITTEIRRTYELRGANSKVATHFQIQVPEANPRNRWVEVACGHVIDPCEPGGPDPEEPGGYGGQASFADNVLAASWQPAFCEDNRHKPECHSQTADRFDASHFALHGLWPQPRDNLYCGVSERDEAIDQANRWAELPAVNLSAAMRAELDKVMPGTRSHLDRHEWIKHGTCYSAAPQEYFAESLQLMEQLNASPVRALFASRIGARVSLDEVRTAFDRAFGQGAGARVEMVCDDGLIIELRIHIEGEIRETSTLPALLAAADPVPATCRGGKVDPAGFRS